MPRDGFKHGTSARLLGRCFALLLSAVAIALAVCGVFGCISAAAEENALPAAPEDARIGVAYLCNLENNLTLYEKGADRKVYPAASVKIMTGLLASRALASRLDERVTVTAGMLAGVSGRQMHLADGEVLTVRDLLYAAICGSYNDAAGVLACLSSGSVEAFVDAMNREARRLGTTSTYYTNPTGLHDPAMSTSALDVALIAREAYADELYMTISSTRVYTIPATNTSDERVFSNRNALISDSSQNYFNGYCRGMSVGMTDEGGWSLVTVSEKNGAQNLCILLGGTDAAEGELIPAYVYANRLLAWGHGNYGYRTVLTAGEITDTYSVGMTGVSSSKAALSVTQDLLVYLPANVDLSALTVTTDLADGELTAPLAAGEIVGVATVTYEGRVVGRADLAVTEDFSRSAFLGAMMAFRDYLCSRAFWITVGVFILLLLPFLRMTVRMGGWRGLRSARRRRRIRYGRRRKIRYAKRRY